MAIRRPTIQEKREAVDLLIVMGALMAVGTSMIMISSTLAAHHFAGTNCEKSYYNSSTKNTNVFPSMFECPDDKPMQRGPDIEDKVAVWYSLAPLLLISGVLLFLVGWICYGIIWLFWALLFPSTK